MSRACGINETQPRKSVVGVSSGIPLCPPRYIIFDVTGLLNNMYEGKQELESLGWLPTFWNREMKTTAVTTVRSHQRSQQALLVILLGGCVASAAPRPTSVAYYTSFTTRARIALLTTQNPRLYAFSHLFFTQFGVHVENRTILQPFFQ